MASFSVKFLAPNFSARSSSSKASSSTSTTRLHATPPQTVAAPPAGAGASADIDPERLEPRVEEKGKYWVLKEKYRQGINPQEKVKIEKDPMKLFIENGIEELAKIPLEEIDKSKLTKDDIDVRLKWLGLFHRRKHHCKILKLLLEKKMLT